jgi:hypothetical protein
MVRVERDQVAGGEVPPIGELFTLKNEAGGFPPQALRREAGIR